MGYTRLSDSYAKTLSRMLRTSLTSNQRVQLNVKGALGGVGVVVLVPERNGEIVHEILKAKGFHFKKTGIPGGLTRFIVTARNV